MAAHTSLLCVALLLMCCQGSILRGKATLDSSNASVKYATLSQHAQQALQGDCGRPEVAASLAAFCMYDSGLVGPMIPQGVLTKGRDALKSAGYRRTNVFEVSSGTCTSLINGAEVHDMDAAHLWKRSRDGHCILAFRGSNCDEGSSFKSITTELKYGHNIHKAILDYEFEPLIERMKKAHFKDCSKLDVTGHSLGAALAAIFAVATNHDKLKLATSVDGTYLFSPARVFTGKAPTNPRSSDGCFAGGVYCNYMKEDGVYKVDQVCHIYPGFFHPKTAYIKMGATSGSTSCGKVTEKLMGGPSKGGLPVHLPHHYVNGLGCSSANMPVPGGADKVPMPGEVKSGKKM